MCHLAAQNDQICAITAAMASGTGLSQFAETYPKRFFDVGIAEEHAVAMAGGLAARGMIPVCAIYSTFLQRAYDQMLHDVAIEGNHVVFAVDRAGLVGADGETHQGAFDVPFVRTVPGMKIFAPANYAELKTALRRATLLENGPVTVRYPRGGEGDFSEDTFSQPDVLLREGCDVTLCAYGTLINTVLQAAKELEKQNISASVVKINALTEDVLPQLEASVTKTGCLLVLEDCVEDGCLGQRLAANLLQKDKTLRLKLCNLGDRFISHGTVQQLYSDYCLDVSGVCTAAKELCHG